MMTDGKGSGKTKFVLVAKSLEGIVSNRLSKRLISHLVSNRVEGESLMSNALLEYSGLKSDLTLLERMKAIPLRIIIDLSRFAIGADRKTLEDLIKNSYSRRAFAIILESLAIYGVTKPQNYSAPFLIVWNYTNACNLRCKHCYQGAGRRNESELGTEEKLGIVDQLDRAGIAAIAFSGGEPLMSKDFFSIVKAVADRGIYVSLATNGTLLTSSIVNRLIESGVKYVEISLDSPDPRVHDELRGVRGSWRKAIEGVRLCVESEKIHTVIASTITRVNFDQLDDIIRLSRELRVNRMVAFNFIPTGRGKGMMTDDLSPQMREELLGKVYGEIDNETANGFQVVSTAPQYARHCISAPEHGHVSVAHFGSFPLTKKRRVLAEFVGGCGAGRMYCAIQPDGKVTPCVFIDLEVGDLQKDAFRGIWANSRTLQTLRTRDDLQGNCGSCQYKNVCGGCRARAYSYFGDLKAPDIGCIRNLRYWESARPP